MLEKVKKIGIIIIIAILFTLLCFSMVDVVIQEPDYSKFCTDYSKPYPAIVQQDVKCPLMVEPSENDYSLCQSTRGYIEYNYDSKGCPQNFKCNNCSAVYEDAGKGYRLIGFIITSILGILAVIIGMYIKSKEDVMEWVFSGLLIGGIATIFIGTMQYFRDMGRFVKPFVLLAEIALIIWVAIRTSRRLVKKKK